MYNKKSYIQNKFLKKTIALIVIAVIATASLPLVCSKNIYTVESQEIIKKESIEPKLIADNIRIRGMGTNFVDLLFLLFTDRPVYFLGLEIWNQNDFPISSNEIITISTKDGRVLDQFSGPSDKIKADWSRTNYFFVQKEWRDAGYTKGFFDMTLDLTIPETDTDISILFHGFIWIDLGAIIFNPNGKLL